MLFSQVHSYYKNLGYNIIPLYYNTKIPMFKNWYKLNSNQQIADILDTEVNFGMILGDVVDIEGDSQSANDFIDNMFHNTPHPIFESNKSRHHLFRSRFKKLSRIVVGGVEYRGHKHQSVIPPSKHEAGVKYKWISDICSFDCLPLLPNFIEDIIISNLPKNKNHKNKKRAGCKPGHVQAYCDKCKSQKYLHEVKFLKEKEFFTLRGQKWMCRTCSK